jgi:hypothetical protein
MAEASESVEIHRGRLEFVQDVLHHSRDVQNFEAVSHVETRSKALASAPSGPFANCCSQDTLIPLVPADASRARNSDLTCVASDFASVAGLTSSWLFGAVFILARTIERILKHGSHVSNGTEPRNRDNLSQDKQVATKPKFLTAREGPAARSQLYNS